MNSVQAKYDGRELAVDLIEQLSKLNQSISYSGSIKRFSDNGWNYLFGFRPEIKSSREDYNRYIVFIRIITDLLKDYGIHITNNGYAYIIDSVMILIDQKSLDLKFNNDVYPLVAFKYGISKTSVIEHNIRNAIQTACADYEKDPEANRMGVFGKRPTNREFLFYITTEVCQKMYDCLGE